MPSIVSRRAMPVTVTPPKDRTICPPISVRLSAKARCRFRSKAVRCCSAPGRPSISSSIATKPIAAPSCCTSSGNDRRGARAIALVITTESAGSPGAGALLQGREAALSALYRPEESFRIPIEKHVRDDVIFLMARENGMAAGCGALQLHSGYGELKSMYVFPAARGKRLAQTLIAALENLARERGFSELKLETGICSPAAIRTYERAGYARCERFGDYPFAPTSVYMAKTLP